MVSNDVFEASLGAANASSLAQHALFHHGVLPASPFLSPLHAGMFPWHQPHPLHAVLQQSLGSPDHVAAAAAAAAAVGLDNSNKSPQVCDHSLLLTVLLAVAVAVVRHHHHQRISSRRKS